MREFLRRFFGPRWHLQPVAAELNASGGEGCNATVQIFYSDGTLPFFGVYEGLPDAIRAVWEELGIDVDEECDIEEERGGTDWYFHWEGTVLR